MVTGRQTRAARSPEAAYAIELYNDVQLCHEMGWTQDELNASDEEFVWAARTILSAESDEMRERNKPRRHP